MLLCIYVFLQSLHAKSIPEWVLVLSVSLILLIYPLFIYLFLPVSISLYHCLNLVILLNGSTSYCIENWWVLVGYWCSAPDSKQDVCDDNNRSILVAVAAFTLSFRTKHNIQVPFFSLLQNFYMLISERSYLLAILLYLFIFVYVSL